MRAPRHWGGARPGLLARLLQPAGAAYGRITLARMARPGVRLPMPVICVGNFVAGGAGKTPTVRALAGLIAGRGLSPFVVSRGYGGSDCGPMRVDPARHTAAEVGDEPLMLAGDGTAVVVSRDRAAGARLAIAQGAGAILLDDGMQNPALSKDLVVAVVDGAAGAGNGLCLPAGPLRGPLAAQMTHADLVLVIGDGAAGERVARAASLAGRPVLRARLTPEAEAAARLRGRRVLAFAGIGRPEKFFTTLAEVGAEVALARPFPDHHRYRADELDALAREAQAAGLLAVTTQKDMARLGSLAEAAFEGELAVLPVRLVPEDDAALARALDATLGLGAQPRATDE